MRFWLLIVLLAAVASAELLSLVSFPRSPLSAIMIVTRFDPANKRILIDKTFTPSLLVQRKLYSFASGRYSVLQNCSVKDYDSIVDEYFTADDVISPTSYDQSASRLFSILYSGSWSNGEMLQRQGDMITASRTDGPTWQMQILAYNNATTDLPAGMNLC